MPHIALANASGSAQRRLLSNLVKKYEGRGYAPGARIEEGQWRDIIARSRSGGLFGEKSFIIVENGQKLGPFPEDLAAVLEGEGAETVLLVACEGDLRRLFPKDVLALATVLKAEEPPRWGAARKKWIDGVAAEEGVRLSGEANVLLGEWFEDGEELRSEIVKLGLAAGGKPVSEELVRAISVDEGKNALLDLLDGLCRGAGERTLKSLQILQRQAEFLPTLAALYNRLRLALHMALGRGEEQERILSALGARDYQRKNAQEAVRRFSSQALKDAVVRLAWLSCAEKRGLGAGWRGMELILLELLGTLPGKRV